MQSMSEYGKKQADFSENSNEAFHKKSPFQFVVS